MTTNEAIREVLVRYTNKQLDLPIEVIAALHEEIRDKSLDWIDQIRNLNINGITTKNFIVNYFKDLDDNWVYQFQLTKEGFKKRYDIYYDSWDGKGELLRWWPKIEDDGGGWEHNGAFQFIPYCLDEHAENCYESKNTLEETLEIFKKCGFERFEEITNE